ncbi:hypothetical protein D9M71_429420 [compost metagenome]
MQGGIEGGANQRRAVRATQATRQQRRQRRLLTRCQQQRFLGGLGNPLLRPYLIFGQALQDLVARRLGAFRVTIRTQAAGSLGQHRKQRCFRRCQVHRRLAKIRPTGRGDALQGATERRAVEVNLEDLRFRQVPLQLRGTP